MTTLKERFAEFRGTSTAKAISAVIFLGLGLYNLVFSPGTATLWIGIPYTALGLFMTYKVLTAATNG